MTDIDIPALIEETRRLLKDPGTDLALSPFLMSVAQALSLAAALERMAREIENTTSERDIAVKAMKRQAARIRELEDELIGINSACDAQIRRANRAEAEAAAIKAKTIEECEQAAGGIGLPESGASHDYIAGWQTARNLVILRIRALNQPAGDGKDEA